MARRIKFVGQVSNLARAPVQPRGLPRALQACWRLDARGNPRG